MILLTHSSACFPPRFPRSCLAYVLSTHYVPYAVLMPPTVGCCQKIKTQSFLQCFADLCGLWFCQASLTCNCPLTPMTQTSFSFDPCFHSFLLQESPPSKSHPPFRVKVSSHFLKQVFSYIISKLFLPYWILIAFTDIRCSLDLNPDGSW